MIPYWFAALTMKSVGKAAGEMVAEVKRQFSIKDPASNARNILMNFPSLEGTDLENPRGRKEKSALLTQ